jgi:hypothetical protein
MSEAARLARQRAARELSMAMHGWELAGPGSEAVEESIAAAVSTAAAHRFEDLRSMSDLVERCAGLLRDHLLLELGLAVRLAEATGQDFGALLDGAVDCDTL